MTNTLASSDGPRAFLGSHALRDDVVVRLTEAIAAGRLTPTPIHEWDPATGTGNMTGLCSRSDLAGYEPTLGWPHAVGTTHELLLRATQRLLPNPAADEDLPPVAEIDPALMPQVTAWLRAIVPGSDLRSALHVFQCRLAGALLDGVPLLGSPAAEVCGLLLDWRRLLLVGPCGECAPGEWAALRGQAGAVARQSQDAARIVAEFVEAAAWPYQDAAVDWPAAWDAFLRDAVRVGLPEALDDATAALLRAADEAWQKFERRAALEPGLDVFKEADDDPHLNAVNQPEVQQRLESAVQIHARALVLELLGHFNASVEGKSVPNEPSQPAPINVGKPASVAEVEGEAQFQTEVLSVNLPVLVDFWAPWCAPCVQFMPSFLKLAEQYEGRVKFVKVNIDANEDLGNSLNIRALPTVILYHGATAVERITTLNRSRICAALDARLAQGA